jgi:hypothetical protein
MNSERANWFDAFQSYVQFYPRLTATMALNAMAVAVRMIPAARVPEPTVEIAQAIKPVIAMKTKLPQKSKKQPKHRINRRNSA